MKVEMKGLLQWCGVLLFLGGATVSQAVPPTAVLTYAPSRARAAMGEEVRVDVIAEVPPGQYQPGCDPPQPLGVGGYAVSFTFDPEILEYLGSSICPGTPIHLRGLVATIPSVANSRGEACTTSVSSTGAPVVFGRACVHSVRFRVRAPVVGSTAVEFGKAPRLGTSTFATAAVCGLDPVAFKTNDGVALLGVGPSAPRSGKGDVNLDGSVDIFDAVTLASCIVGNTKIGVAPFVAGPSAADENGDGELDVFDLVGLVASIVQGQ